MKYYILFKNRTEKQQNELIDIQTHTKHSWIFTENYIFANEKCNTSTSPQKSVARRVIAAPKFKLDFSRSKIENEASTSVKKPAWKKKHENDTRHFSSNRTKRHRRGKGCFARLLFLHCFQGVYALFSRAFPNTFLFFGPVCLFGFRRPIICTSRGTLFVRGKAFVWHFCRLALQWKAGFAMTRRRRLSVVIFLVFFRFIFFHF